MGQLEFGRERELLQRREVASLSDRRKTGNICPHLFPHFRLYISAEADGAVAGASSAVKRLTPLAPECFSLSRRVTLN